MKLRSLGKWTGITLAVMVVLLVAGWLTFVPWAEEPGYVFVAAWGEPGSGPGQFNDPTGIAVAGEEVFISDARNGRIQVFDFDGNFKREFGSNGDGAGRLGRPMNLTVAGDSLYVADYWNDRVEVFGLDGAHRRSIGRKGNGPGEFDAPGGVDALQQCGIIRRHQTDYDNVARAIDMLGDAHGDSADKRPLAGVRHVRRKQRDASGLRTRQVRALTAPPFFFVVRSKSSRSS